MKKKSLNYLLRLFLGIFLFVEFGCSTQTADDLKFEKALWCHKTTFVIDGNYRADSVLNQYKNLGISTLFYGVGFLPYSDWNFLDSLIVDCHRYNIELHPYIIVGYKNDPNSDVVKNHPEWMVVRMDGEKTTNLNLANAEVRDFVVRLSAPFLDHDIDGLHLDYIRFDLHQNFSYDSLTCEIFKNEYGTSPLDLDKDTGDPLWCEWLDWNAGKVTQLVRDLREMIKRSGRDIPLSAAVFPDARAAKYEIGQEWELWVKEGLLDIVCPMIYVKNTPVFTKYVVQAMEISQGKAKVIVGIWLGNRYHRNVDPETMAEHMLITKKEGAGGTSFWSARSFTEEYQQKFKTLNLE